MSKFNKGDIVALKTGGKYTMLIDNQAGYGPDRPGELTCLWMDQYGRLQRAQIDEGLLELYIDPELDSRVLTNFRIQIDNIGEGGDIETANNLERIYGAVVDQQRRAKL